ncbi:MAG TPA: hypothetical protein VMY43_10905 [Methanothrix sp.]|jgi:hypothetical protein|nr:hypothetical protein [Methanothrix sp.]
MRWLWRRQAKLIEPRRAVSIRAQELETAKEILAEVFCARPGEVEEMIRSRLEERIWPEEKEAWQKEREEGRWPATFCLGE